LSLTGPDGLFKQLTKTVIETALNQQLTEHLGHEKNGAVTGNVRNGTRSKAVLTEATGRVRLDVPRDRDGSFEPMAGPIETTRALAIPAGDRRNFEHVPSLLPRHRAGAGAG
jgi:transposase-like protein